MYKKGENKAKKAKIRAPTGCDPRTSGSKIRRLTDCAMAAWLQVNDKKNLYSDCDYNSRK
jgi:hypothetical protein